MPIPKHINKNPRNLPHDLPDDETEASRHIDEMLAEEEYYFKHGEPGDTDDA